MNTAYPFIPVSVLILMVYFFTWLFSKWGLISSVFFRKFWNSLLLIAFLISGLIGILSVIKINYKLTIPKYDTLLKWHVSVGIAMVFIAFFHIVWHLRYFTRIFKKTAAKKLIKTDFQPDKDEDIKFRGLLFLLGFITIISQVVFIREFICVVSGNELVIGIVMSVWMLLTALGAYAGRKRLPANPGLKQGFKMLALLSFMPIILISILYYFKYLLFPPGTITGIGITITGSILLLFPVCFLSGYLFTFFSVKFSNAFERNLTGKSYAFESLGSLIGGLIFSLILGNLLDSFQVFGLISGLILITWASTVNKKNTGEKILLIVLGFLLPIAIFSLNPYKNVKKILYPNQQIILNKNTPYGNLIVAEQAGQYNFYENNSLQFYTENLMLNEEAVHFVMVQHKNPENILLLSGGVAGMVNELEKYHLKNIDYLEINPEIVANWKKFSEFDQSSVPVHFFKSDIRKFLRKNKNLYDVILINLPPPSTLGFNRFYTTEFVKSIKQHCTPESVICTSLPSTANYTEENVLNVNASLYNTLKNHFKEVLVLQGEKNFFLATDKTLTTTIAEKIDSKGINNEYVNSYYFDDFLIDQRSRLLTSEFSKGGQANHDFYPVMFLAQINHWLSRFGASYLLFAIIPIIGFLFFFFRLNKISIGLYTGGFSAASLEIVLMLAYQVFFGSLYIAVALFFSVFMGGLAAGSYAGPKIQSARNIKLYYLLQSAIALFALVIPATVMLISRLNNIGILTQGLFFILTFILSFSIGFEFYLASEIQPLPVNETSGLNYSTDLAGSAFGAFISAIVLLPLTGIVNTCLIISGLNIFSAIMAFSVRNKFVP
ncbi:MAG: hypothetical protein JXR31_14010 [Prolixibacteraceae bacterium]|nr:hypothetical protein [Prolixibacteraceae bacterium]